MARAIPIELDDTLLRGGGVPYADLARLGFDAFRSGNPAGSLAGAGGAALGGKAGAALGTAVLPGVGTAIGSALGSAVGASASAIPKLFGGGKKAKAKKAAQSAPMEAPRQSFDPGFLEALMASGLPQYAAGAARQPGGPAIVGELGPELAFLSPESPVIPMIPPAASFDPSGFVEEPAAQMGQRDGFFADVARGLGSNPFGAEGSLGGIAQLASQALGGKRGNDNFGGRLGLAVAGGLGNVLVNRELGEQSEIEKMNERLRERAKLRNAELREIAKENRTSARTRGDKVFESKLRREEAADKETREATSEAAKRRFILGNGVADKLGLPRGERVTFEQYTKALDAARDTQPKSDFDRILAASPAEWQQYVKRKGELDKATSPPKAEKPTTADERRAASFYNTARSSVDAVTKPDKSGASIEDRVAQVNLNPVAGLVGKRAWQALKGADRQRYEQAVRTVAQVVLRRFSGAAIKDEEFDQIDREFFSQPGDLPETRAQKNAARENILNGLAFEAGPAAEQLRGTTPSGGATHRYNPATGEVEPIGAQ